MIVGRSHHRMTCDDHRSSSHVSDNREGLVGSRGAIRSERDSSFSSKLITSRLIRSVIVNAPVSPLPLVARRVPNQSIHRQASTRRVASRSMIVSSVQDYWRTSAVFRTTAALGRANCYVVGRFCPCILE